MISSIRASQFKSSPLPTTHWSALAVTALGFALFLSLLVALPTVAQDAELKGLEIATEADRRDSGFQDTRVELTMTLFNARGESTLREMRQLALEVEGDGDKSIMVFDRPRDLKGTAILTYTHKTGADDQWLFFTSGQAGQTDLRLQQVRALHG